MTLFSLDASKDYYRFLVLAFNCLLTFGGYFCYDMPSVLQTQLQDPRNSTTCPDCLGLGPENYNLLYAVYAWMNAVLAIVTGYLIDKIGGRMAAVLFAAIASTGALVFCLGPLAQDEASLLPILLAGRLIFGMGAGTMMSINQKILSYWFLGKELGLAVGFTIAVPRLGSVLNFFLTSHIYAALGLQKTLLVGFFLCLSGLLSALILFGLDAYGTRQLRVTGKENIHQAKSPKMKLTDFKKLPLMYWLLVLNFMFFYGSTLTFVANGTKLFQDFFHYAPSPASYLVGGIYDISIFLIPILGATLDSVGRRGHCMILLFILALLGFLAIGLPSLSVPPLVAILLLGGAYSGAAASYWSALPLVVGASMIGSASGLAMSSMTLTMGLSNLVVGAILERNDGDNKWVYVMLFFCALSLAGLVAAILLNIVNAKKKGTLNLSKKAMAEKEEPLQITTPLNKPPEQDNKSSV